MEIKKLLFVTSFEELCFDALRSLLELRKASLNHIVFLNVIERDKVAMQRGTGYRKQEEVRLREMANIRFIDWAETLFEQGMEVGVHIVVGNLVKQIAEAVEKEKADLIVIGHQKKSKLQHLYSGSDVITLIQRSKTPVLVYKYMDDQGKTAFKPFDKPLLAAGFSDSDRQAVLLLKGLQSVIKEIDIVHTAEEKQLIGDSAMSIQKTRKECRRKLDEICEQFEAQGITARPHVYIGDALTEIEKAARECESTLIAAGISGKSSWKTRWTGSIPQKLAENSMLPILLIPSEPHPDESA